MKIIFLYNNIFFSTVSLDLNLIADDGSVWGCGWNAYGQLGKRPSVLLNADEMTRLTLPFSSNSGDNGVFKVVGVRCGAWNSALLVGDDMSLC